MGKLITDPETEEGKDGHTEKRGRDNHGNSHIDMRRDTEMNRNCEPDPIQSSWQDWAWRVSHGLACSPEWLWALLSRDYNSAGKGAGGKLPQTQEILLSNMWPQS